MGHLNGLHDQHTLERCIERAHYKAIKRTLYPRTNKQTSACPTPPRPRGRRVDLDEAQASLAESKKLREKLGNRIQRFEKARPTAACSAQLRRDAVVPPPLTKGANGRRVSWDPDVYPAGEEEFFDALEELDLI